MNRVHPINSIPIPTTYAPTASALPLPAYSTIEPAPIIEKSASLCRPVLEAPLVHYMYPILQIYSRMDTLAQKELEISDGEVSKLLNRLLTLDKQKIEMLSRLEKDRHTQGTWSAFERVAQYVSSFSSIVLGLSIIGPSPIVASFLIASGGLALINRAVIDSVGWEWILSRFIASVDVQRKLAEQIDTCLVSISTALCIFGAIGAWNANSWEYLYETTHDVVLNRALQILAFTTGTMQAVTGIGMALLDKKIVELKSDIKKQDTLSACTRKEIPRNSENLLEIIKLSERLSEITKQIIAQ